MSTFYRLINNPLFLAIAFFAIGVVCISLLFVPTLQSYKEEQTHIVREKANIQANNIRRGLYYGIGCSQSLATFVEHHAETPTRAEFEMFLSSLISSNNDYVDYLAYIIKDDTVEMIGPDVGTNKLVEGFVLSDKSNKRARIIGCQRNRKTYVEVLDKLHNLEKNVSFYSPTISINDTLKNQKCNVTNIAIHWNKFTEVAGFNEDVSDLELAIKEEHHGLNDVFYGDANLFSKEDIVTIDIELPVGKWVLAAYPRHQYQYIFSNIPPHVIIALIVTFILSIVVYFIVRANESRINEYEEKYQFITDRTNDVLWIIDSNTLNHKYVSDSCFYNFGYSPNEYRKTSLLKMLTPESQAIIIEAGFPSAPSNGQQNSLQMIKDGVILELQQYHKNGKLMWVEVSFAISMNKRGEYDEIIGVSRIINDRKELEISFRETEDRYRMIAENSKDAIWLIDTKTMSYSFVSASTTDITGFRADEMLNKRMSIFIPAESYDIISKALMDGYVDYKRGLSDTIQNVFDMQIYCKDGSLIWTSVSIKAVFDKSNATVGTSTTSGVLEREVDFAEGGTSQQPAVASGQGFALVAIVRNIEEQKKLEFKLKEIEKIFLAITNYSNDHMWILNGQTMQFTYNSPTSIYVTGYTPKELSSDRTLPLVMDTAKDIRPLSTVLGREYIAKASSIIAGGGFGDKEWNDISIFELQMYHRDGQLIWVEITILGADDIVQSIVDEAPAWEYIGITRNIDMRKKLELSLRESERKYRLITENTKDMIWTMDLSIAKFGYVSTSCLSVTGYTPDEYVKKPLTELMPVEWFNTMYQLLATELDNYYYSQGYHLDTAATIKDVVPKGQGESPEKVFEMQQYHKNGDLIWVETSARITQNNEGKFEQIVGVTRRIDKRKELELKLLRNEKIFLAINENLSDLIWILDAKTMQYTYQSEAALVINGYATDEAINRSASSSFTSDTYKFVIGEIVRQTEQLKRGEISKIRINFEAQLVKKDKSLVWVDITSTAITDNDNNPIEFIGITRIIEERKQLELQLKESEYKYNMITQNQKDLIWIADLRTKNFIFVGDICNSMFGWSVEECLQMNMRDVLLPDEYQSVNELIKSKSLEYMQSGVLPEFSLELQIKNNFDGMDWVEWACKIIANDYGELYQITGTTRIINTRKKLELSLKENENKYRLIAESIRDVIWTVDMQTWKYLYVNSAIYEASGFTPEEFTKLRVQDITTPATFAYLVERFDLLMKKYENGEISEPKDMLEVQKYDKFGNLDWVEVSFKMVKNHSSVFNQIVAVVRVINDRKKLEVEIQKKQKELELVNTTKDKLCSIVLCDVKNPLTNVLQLSESLVVDYQQKRYEALESSITTINETLHNACGLLEKIANTEH